MRIVLQYTILCDKPCPIPSWHTAQQQSDVAASSDAVATSSVVAAATVWGALACHQLKRQTKTRSALRF